MGEKEGPNGRHQPTVDLLRELAASLDALTNAASPHAGLNRTDMRALDIINMQQGLTAGQLAGRLKLTTGAITGVLDRLERGGHARRTHDVEDRRRVVVQPTPEARRFGSVLFRQLDRDLDELMSAYSPDQRSLVEEFLRTVTERVIQRAEELSTLERKGA